LNIHKSLLVLILILVAPAAMSQGAFRFGPDERANEFDISFHTVYTGSESVSGPNGSGLKVDDDWGFGLAVAYNFTNHLALGFEMSFLNPRYEYTIVPDQPNSTPQTVNHRADIFNGVFRGTYNILKGPVSPFIDVAAGWRYLDSNVASGPPITGCWWDPWWGYICRPVWNTYSDTSFTYGGGLGLRWDVSRDMFLRATYSLMKTDSGASSDPTFDMLRFEIGWRN